MRRSFFICFAYLAGVASLLSATEGAFPLYLNGYMGPKAGFMPPPGLYVRNDIYHHPGHVSANVLGGRVSAKSNVKISLDLLNFTYVTPYTLLGANLGGCLLIPVGRVNVHAQLSATVPSVAFTPLPSLTLNSITKSKHQVAHGIADTMVVPFMLGWHAPSYNLHIIAFQGVFLPTGGYTKGKIANMGQNHFASETDVGFTWLNEKSGTEVSAMTGVTVNFTNHKIHYRSGTGWHTDFYAGQYLTSKLQVGLSGYWFYQLTPDTGTGSKVLGGFRSHVLGLGPSISYEFSVCGLPITACARYFKETHSRNYIKGETFYFTVSVPIP